MQICVRVDGDRLTVRCGVSPSMERLVRARHCVLSELSHAIQGAPLFMSAYVSMLCTSNQQRLSYQPRFATILTNGPTTRVGRRLFWGPFLRVSPGWLWLKVPSRIRKRLKHTEWSTHG